MSRGRVQTRPLQGDGEHTTAGACRRGLVRGHDVHHPAAECIQREAVDRQAAQVEQTRGVTDQIVLNIEIRVRCNKPMASF
jgi:hypothetical protein